jgi:hypothetical protein
MDTEYSARIHVIPPCECELKQHRTKLRRSSRKWDEKGRQGKTFGAEATISYIYPGHFIRTHQHGESSTKCGSGRHHASCSLLLQERSHSFSSLDVSRHATVWTSSGRRDARCQHSSGISRSNLHTKTDTGHRGCKTTRSWDQGFV